MGQQFGHAASFALSVVKMLEDQKGFAVLPRRRVNERSLGWLVKQRRLMRNHEKNPRHRETLVCIAFIGLTIERLTSPKPADSLAGQALNSGDGVDEGRLHAAPNDCCEGDPSARFAMIRRNKS